VKTNGIVKNTSSNQINQ